MIAGENIQREHRGLVIAGWICTLLIAPVGFIIGIILTAKGRWGHGVAMMVVCVLWLSVIVTATSSDTSTTEIQLEAPTAQDYDDGRLSNEQIQEQQQIQENMETYCVTYPESPYC